MNPIQVATQQRSPLRLPRRASVRGHGAAHSRCLTDRLERGAHLPDGLGETTLNLRTGTSAAEASSASPKRSGHSARSRLLVSTIDARSYRSLMTS